MNVWISFSKEQGTGINSSFRQSLILGTVRFSLPAVSQFGKCRPVLTVVNGGWQLLIVYVS
jgi:hypothetical protein